MHLYPSDTIDSRLFRFSKKVNIKKLLTSKNWIIIDEFENRKSIYFFSKKDELFISTNGIVEKGRWYCFGKEKIVIEENGKSHEFEICFLNNDILILKLIDSWNEYVFYVNEEKKGVKSLDGLIYYLKSRNETLYYKGLRLKAFLNFSLIVILLGFILKDPSWGWILIIVALIIIWGISKVLRDEDLGDSITLEFIFEEFSNIVMIPLLVIIFTMVILFGLHKIYIAL
jgi:hypothetical protein